MAARLQRRAQLKALYKGSAISRGKERTTLSLRAVRNRMENAIRRIERRSFDIVRRIPGLPAESVQDALELVGLSGFGKRLAKKYSLGMKQRLGLALALICFCLAH